MKRWIWPITVFLALAVIALALGETFAELFNYR